MTSNVIDHMCTLMNTKHLLTTAYHPQTDGMTERFNSTLEQMLSVYLTNDDANGQKCWDQILSLVVFAYNTSKHATTQAGVRSRCSATSGCDSMPTASDRLHTE
eukprot:GDKI01015414.1.p3 GENE.GDKI01015414.1~~GDKI01015414.1.p3  ORF type:complete len:104 (+),score=19.59 GDKI01015414.1:835-1146(+)